MGIRGLEPGLFVKPDFGNQTDFYKDVFKKARDVIPHINKEVTGMERMGLPYLRVNCSVGNLESGTNYRAAVLEPGKNPYEWNLTFNQDNPDRLGPYKTAAVFTHEYIHMRDRKLSEHETEKTNIKALEKAGKKEIAELWKKTSMYV